VTQLRDRFLSFSYVLSFRVIDESNFFKTLNEQDSKLTIGLYVSKVSDVVPCSEL